jgi:RNase P/RNase MRP subunit POP5
MVRFKNRYILFEVLWEDAYYVAKDMSASTVHQHIKQFIDVLYGNVGVAALAHSLTGKFVVIFGIALSFTLICI